MTASGHVVKVDPNKLVCDTCKGKVIPYGKGAYYVHAFTKKASNTFPTRHYASVNGEDRDPSYVHVRRFKTVD